MGIPDDVILYLKTECSITVPDNYLVISGSILCPSSPGCSTLSDVRGEKVSWLLRILNWLQSWAGLPESVVIGLPAIDKESRADF